MMRTVIIWLILSGLGSPPFAAARTAENLESMFLVSAAEFGLSVDLLRAIGRVESGLNPWAVNVAGQGHQFSSKEEALDKLREARAAGLSFDIGVMQINNWWLDKSGLSLEAALEPMSNIRLGGWILKQELERYGNLRQAVGAYHSPQPHKAGPYAGRVLAAMKKEDFMETAPAPFKPSAPKQSRNMKISGSLPIESMKVRKREYE